MGADLGDEERSKEVQLPRLDEVLHGDVLKSDLGELFSGCVDNVAKDTDFLKKALDFSLNRKS